MSGGWNYGSKNGYNVVGEGDCQEGGHGWNELGQGKPGRFPKLPMELKYLMLKANLLKKYAGQMLQWFTKPYGLRMGQGQFPGWVFKVDRARFSLTDPYLSGIEES